MRTKLARVAGEQCRRAALNVRVCTGGEGGFGDGVGWMRRPAQTWLRLALAPRLPQVSVKADWVQGGLGGVMVGSSVVIFLHFCYVGPSPTFLATFLVISGWQPGRRH